MGFSAEHAEAALIEFGSLNAALDALMGGFQPPEEEEPAMEELEPAFEPIPAFEATPVAAPAAAAPVASSLADERKEDPAAAAAAALPPIPALISAPSIESAPAAAAPVLSAAPSASAESSDAVAIPPAVNLVPDEEDDDQGGADEEDDEMAAAIAMSMAAAAEDEAREAEQAAEAEKAKASATAATVSTTDAAAPTAVAAAPSSSSTAAPASDAKSASDELKQEESKAAEKPAESAPTVTPAQAPTPVASAAPVAAPLTTESWFDSYCRVSDLLHSFASGGPLPTGIALACHDLGASTSVTAQSPHSSSAASLESEHSSFTPAVDAEIVSFANTIETKMNVKFLTKMRESSFFADLGGIVKKAEGLRAQFPLLNVEASNSASSLSLTPNDTKSIRLDMLTRRLALLLYLNYQLQGLLPLVDLTQATSSADHADSQAGRAHTIAHHLSFFRSLLLNSVKLDFFHSILDITAMEGEAESKRHRVKVVVDRLAAAAHPGSLKHSIFHQAFLALAHVNPAFLVPAKPVGNPHLSFDIGFRGESVVGESGPYREVLNDFVRELQASEPADKPAGSPPTVLPFLIPSVNHRVATGDGRDRWIFNPSCVSDSDQQHLVFLGQLIGMSIRTGIQLPFSFPPLVWQQLLDIAPTRADLEGVDCTFTNVLAQLEADVDESAGVTEAVLESRFRNHFGGELYWSVNLSDGSAVELRPDGANTPVEFADRKEYARLAEWTRFHENLTQIRAVRKGLTSILPASTLALFGAAEFERLVCGVPFIDIDLLKRHTEYSNLKETDDLIVWFWRCLEEMSQEERRSFLVFSWAQQRMPSTDDEFTTRSGQKIRLLIKAQSSTGKKGARDSADSRFPTADTCFFNLSLPQWSSYEVLRRQMRIVLSTSSGMDGDDVALMEREVQEDFDEQQALRQAEERAADASDPAGDEPAEEEDEPEEEASEYDEGEDDPDGASSLEEEDQDVEADDPLEGDDAGSDSALSEQEALDREAEALNQAIAGGNEIDQDDDEL
jgi:hypothetical protein